jgi:hypothetical protein
MAESVFAIIGVMPADHQIRLVELRELCTRLLDAAEAKFGPEIDIGPLSAHPADPYWVIAAQSAFASIALPSRPWEVSTTTLRSHG